MCGRCLTAHFHEPARPMSTVENGKNKTCRPRPFESPSGLEGKGENVNEELPDVALLLV